MEGIIELSLGNFSIAKRFLNESLNFWKKNKKLESVTKTLNDLGNLFYQQKKFIAAQEYFEDALKEASKINDDQLQAICNGSVGEIFLSQNKFNEAQTYFEQEIDLAKKHRLVEIIAHAQSGLARVYENKEDLPQAFSLAKAALETFERLQHKSLSDTKDLMERLLEKSSP